MGGKDVPRLGCIAGSTKGEFYFFFFLNFWVFS